MDPSLVNPAIHGTVVSPQAGFCLPAASGTQGISVTSNTANNVVQSQLPMTIGSMLAVNQTQFMQPLNVQQQTLSIPLNQQQNLTSGPQTLTINQMPSSINLGNQPISLTQVVCSSTPNNMNFVNPTLITVSGVPGTGTQNQFLQNPFSQFPLVLNNQASIIPNMNNFPLQAQRTIVNSNFIQQSSLNQVPPSTVVITQSLIKDVLSSHTSLSSKPVSVVACSSPTMSVAPIMSASHLDEQSQPSPDTTANIIPSDPNSATDSQDHILETDIVSSSTPTAQSNRKTIDNQKRKCIQVTDLIKLNKDDNNCKDLTTKEKYDPSSHLNFSPIECVGTTKTTTMNSSSEADSGSSNTSEHFNDSNSSSSLFEDRTRDRFTDSSSSKESTKTTDTESNSNESSKPSSFETLESVSLEDDIQSKTDAKGVLTDVEDLDHSEFIWEDYLQETGASAVPPTAFKHVETSLQSGFTKGMKLEAPNKLSPNTYWVATIVMTCGPLLRLRYEGYHNNSAADFWSDPMTSDIHPIGWCEENGKTLLAPEEIKSNFPDWQKFLERSLKDALFAPSYLLDKSTGSTPVDQVREGMCLEMQESLRPNRVWLARVRDNVGGRLYLRTEGHDSESYDFWMFYLHHRLHPVGWAEARGYTYDIPLGLEKSSGKSKDELWKIHKASLAESSSQELPEDIFNDQIEIQPHKFEVGMMLEAVDIDSNSCICPASVVEVVDHHYFIIAIDNMTEEKGDKTRYCCHRGNPLIFPVRWNKARGLKISAPKGWTDSEFSWDKYLQQTGKISAPESLFSLDVPEHEFEVGQKLEAVKPGSPGVICAATVTKLVDHLVWVHLDSGRLALDTLVVGLTSLSLFPIGWCASNGFPLKPPGPLTGAGLTKQRVVALVQPEQSPPKTEGSSQNQNGMPRELYGGALIYFNHRCFSGPYLSKGRIAGLPRSVGPGPVSLVMTEVLGMLINTAYKSSRVLKELQADGRSDPGMTQQTLKAKYKGKSYRAVVDVCRTTGQLDAFCRMVCEKLDCCPYIISPRHVNGHCPENCGQQSKTKYTVYGRRRKRIGRPPGGHSNLENGQKKPGKRKKRRIGMMGHRKSPSPDGQENGEDDKASVCSDTRPGDDVHTEAPAYRPETPTSHREREAATSPYQRGGPGKRRYTHHIPPPSEIQTRGAKRPKYAFERKTHKKIMIAEGTQQRARKEMQGALSVSSPSPSIDSSFCVPPSLPVNFRSEPPLRLESNPLQWKVADVTRFLETTDCTDPDLLAKLKTEDIDGQALLLLTLPNVQEFLGVKLGPAIKLCHIIERVKIAFYHNYAK